MSTSSPLPTSSADTPSSSSALKFREQFLSIFPQGSFLYNFAKDFLAGGIASIGAKTAFAPVDRVKLLLQTQAINTSLTVPYRSPIDCIVRVYREQGFLSFWRGNLANVYRYFPNQAMNFAFKDRYKELVVRERMEGLCFLSQNQKMLISNLLSGGLAGGTALIISYPFEVARTRLATDIGNEKKSSVPRRFHGTFDCFRKTVMSEGVRGLYSGLGISMAGVILFKALYMGGYDSCKHFFTLEKESLTTKFFVAQVLTSTVGTICYPIDTIKRRLMIQENMQPEHRIYRGAFDCLQKIISREGVKGLFSGLSVNLVRGISGALLLVGYDEIKTLLKDH